MNKNLFLQFFYLNKNSFILLILGLLTVFLFAPFYLFFLGFFIFSIFALYLYRAKSFIKFNNLTFYFFLGFFVSNFYWISFSFLTNKNYIYFFPIIFILIPVSLALSSSFLLSLLAYIKFKYKLKLPAFYFMFSFYYFLHELIRSNMIFLIDFQGLPWNLIGYSFFNYDLIVQSASIFGVYGLTLIAIYLFTLPILLYQLKQFQKLFVIILFIVPLFLSLSYYGYYHKSKKLTNIDNYKISLIHSNISKHHGFQTESIKNNIDNIINNINRSKASDLTIIAEGIVPNATYKNYNPVFDYIIENTQNKYEQIIIGSPRSKLSSDYYEFHNSLFLINKNNIVNSYYDKVNLVPFGEYNPILKALPILVYKSGFSFGQKNKQLLNINEKLKAVPLICYDAIFPGKFSQDGDFLLNITNDIWFTKKLFKRNISVAPWQHFDLVRMRAIEEGKPLIRVANYGITAVTDSFGEVIQKITFNDQDSPKQILLPGKVVESTIFNKYRNLPIYIFAMLNIIFIFIYLRKIKD